MAFVRGTNDQCTTDLPYLTPDRGLAGRASSLGINVDSVAVKAVIESRISGLEVVGEEDTSQACFMTHRNWNYEDVRIISTLNIHVYSNLTPLNVLQRAHQKRKASPCERQPKPYSCTPV